MKRLILFLLFVCVFNTEVTELTLNEEKTITVSATGTPEELSFTPTLNEGKVVEFLIYGEKNVADYTVNCKNNKEVPEEKEATKILVNTKMCYFDITQNVEGENISLTVSNMNQGDTFKVIARYLDATKEIPITMNSIVNSYVQSDIASEVCYKVSELDSTKEVVLNINELDNKILYAVKSSNSEIVFKYNTALLIAANELPTGQFCFQIYGTEPNFAVSFQLYYLESIAEHEKENPLLENGIIYKRYLPMKKFYSVNFKADTEGNSFISLDVMKGRMNLYAYTCTETSPCYYTTTEAKPTGLPISDYSNNVYRYKSSVNTEAYVLYCDPEGFYTCEYYISRHTSSGILLNEAQDYFVQELNFKANIDQYTANNITKITFSASSIMGSCHLTFNEEPELVPKYTVRGKVVYEITSNFKSQYNFKAEKISIGEAVKISYCTVRYMINYDNKAPLELTAGIDHIEELSKSDGVKEFKITKFEITEAPQLIRVESLECTTKMTFNGTTTEPSKYHQAYIMPDEPLYKEDFTTFSVEVDAYDADWKTNTEYCTVIIAGGTVMRSMVISETIKHPIKLDTMRAYSFFLPNVSPPFITVDTPMTPNVGIKVTLELVKQQVVTQLLSETIYKTTTFNIYNEFEQACQKGTSCSVKGMLVPVVQGTYDVNDYVYLSYSHFHEGSAMYFDKNTFMSQSLHAGRALYYYTEIGKGEAGFIHINKLIGGGTVYNLLVDRKEQVGQKGWNGMVDLPTTDEGSSLKYHATLNGILYTASDTAKCENGCYLYMGFANAITSDAGQKPGSPLNTIFHFYKVKNGFKEIVTFSLGEHIEGIINNSQFDKEYRTTISNGLDIDRVIVSFRSKFVDLFINTNETVPTSVDYKYKISSSQTDAKIIEIKASDLGLASLKGVTLTLSAFCITNYKNLFSDFEFIIEPQYKDTPNIISIPNNQERDDLLKKGEFIYYKYQINQFAAESKIAVNVNIKENPKQVVKFYYTQYTETELDPVKYDTSIKDKLPTVNSPSGDNFIIIERSASVLRKGYVFIAVTFDSTQMISISVSSLYPNKEIVPDVFRRGYALKPNSGMEYKRNFYFSSSFNRYSIHLHTPNKAIVFTPTIESVSPITIQQATNYYMLINENTESQPITIKTEAADQDNFILSLMAPLQYSENFIEIRPGNSIINIVKLPFPLTFYMAIPRNFGKITFSISTETVTDPQSELNVTGYLVTEYEMKDWIIDERKQFDEKYPISYNAEKKAFIYEMSNDSLYGKYLIFTIVNKGTTQFTSSLFNINTEIDLSYEAPQLDILIGRRLRYNIRKTFRMERSCDDCNWFRIEMNSVYRKINELNIYPDFSYECDMGTEPKFVNGTQGIITAESSETNGVRRILLQIDPAVVTSKAIYYSLINKNTKGESIPEDYSIAYVVKFSQAKTKEELAPLVFDSQITLTKMQSEMTITFKEALNDTNIKESLYYIIGLNPKKYSIEGVTSIFPHLKLIAQYDGFNDGRKYSLSFTLPYEEGIICTVVASYSFKNKVGNYSIAYTPAEYDAFPKPSKFYMSEINSIYRTQTFKLRREKDTDKFFFIEFNNEAKKDGSHSGRELPILFQKEKEVSSGTNSTFTNYSSFENGKTSLVLATNNEPLIVLTFGRNSYTEDTKFIFKYYTKATKEEEEIINFNNSVSAYRIGNRATISFTEIFNNTNTSNPKAKETFYMVRLTPANAITDETDLDNIYPNSTLEYDQRNVTVTNEGKLITQSQLLESNITTKLFANVFVKYILENGTEGRVSYKHTEVIVKPKEIEQPKAKEYTQATLNSTTKAISYKLVPTNSTTSIYIIEIVNNNNKQTPAYDFSYETTKDTPDLKNDTTITYKSQTNKLGIHKIILEGKGLSDIMFTVFLKETTTNEVGVFDFSFKYKTVVSEEEDAPKYSKPESFKISNSFSTITFSFNELFLKKEDVDSTNYILSLYQQSDITNKEELNNVNYLKQPVEKYYTKTYVGNNDGSLLKRSIDWPEQLTGKLYARIIVAYITNDKENRLDVLGVEAVGSFTALYVTLIIVGCVVLLGVIVALLYFLVFRKKTDSNEITKDEKVKMDGNNEINMQLL